MNSSIEPLKMDRPARFIRLDRSNLKTAVQSALAAALCLGLPAGLLFWLIAVQRWIPSATLDRLVRFFFDHLLPPVQLEMIGACGWGVCLSKISGYRQWWWLSLATMIGVWVGNFALYHGWLPDWVQRFGPPNFRPHVYYGLVLGINVLSVTVSTGLLLGLTLMDWKASLILATSTGLISVLAALMILFILDGLGIRVGNGNAAMVKVTAATTMAAALAGGVTLGVMFSHYVRTGSLQNNVLAD